MNRFGCRPARPVRDEDRHAVGACRSQPVPCCRLLPVGTGEQAREAGASLTVELVPARKAPGLHRYQVGTVTSLATGAQAYAAAGLARVYFPCRPRGAAREIVVHTVVRGPGDAEETSGEERTRLIALANAAALQESAKLGCPDDRLAPGVPSPLPPPVS